jgi:hypothetical protein
MNAVFGDSTPAPASLTQSTRIVFHTQHFELKWSLCSSSADFLSKYFSGVLRENRTPDQVNELAHSISYLANELIENVIKFRAAGNVEIEAGLDDDLFLLRLTNWISPETSDRFQSLLREITAGDPGELLIERIEANAADEANSSASGLGLLTLMSDYGIRMTWNFQSTPDDPERVHLETIARLLLPDQTASSTAHRHHGN